MTEVTGVLDQLLAPVPGGIGRYAAEISRAMAAAPGHEGRLAGLVTRADAAALESVSREIPGLSRLTATRLPRQLLSRAWAAGIVLEAPSGHVYAPSLLAPLGPRRRHAGARTVVTLHDTVPWTHPHLLTPHGVRWHRTMAARAWQYADAIAVPTAAVAAECAEVFGASDRFTVIGGAVSSQLALPAGADAVARALGLPERFVVAVGTLEPRKGLHHVIAALRHVPGMSLVIVGPRGWGDVDIDAVIAREAIEPGRVHVLGRVSDAELAVTLSRATSLVFPSAAEGFGLPVLEAMSLGTPVIHSDAPAVAEVAGRAGLQVARGEDAEFAVRLGVAIDSIATQSDESSRLARAGLARVAEFSWERSAARVWQLFDA